MSGFSLVTNTRTFVPNGAKVLLLLIASCLAFNTIAKESARKTATLESNNKALVQAAFGAWAMGIGGPFDLLTTDASWTIVGKSLASKNYPNKEAFMRDVIRPFNARMSKPLRPTVRKIYADGETVIVFFDAQGTATDGQVYENTYVWILEMQKARVHRVWAIFDSIEFNDLWTRVEPAPVN